MSEKLAPASSKHAHREGNDPWVSTGRAPMGPDAVLVELKEMEEAQTHHKHGVKQAERKSRTLKEDAELMRERLAKQSSMIFPFSKKMRRWDVVILSALFFTAFAGPFEVALIDTVEVNLLFFLNRLVDIVFIFDIWVQFHTPYLVNDKVWETDPKKVADWYMKNNCFMFAADVISVVPWDIFYLAHDDADVYRYVRLFRLLKLAKLFNLTRIFDRWEQLFEIRYSTLNMVKFVLFLTFSAHIFACAWGGLGADLEQRYASSWLSGYYQSFSEDALPETLVFQQAQLNLDNDKWGIYLLAMHWAVMTITSIGYGDISPSLRSEYGLCVVLQMLGGVIWAYTIGSVTSLIASFGKEEMEFEELVDEVMYMSNSRKLPEELRLRVREYFFLNRKLMRSKGFAEIESQVSPQLQGEIALHSSKDLIFKVPYLVGCEPLLTIEIAKALSGSTVAPREQCRRAGTLSLLERGLASVKGKILCSGAFWGEDFIIAQRLQDQAPVLALSYVTRFDIQKDFFEELILNFPKARAKVNKARVKLTFIRSVIVLAEAVNFDPEEVEDFREKDSVKSFFPLSLVNLVKGSEAGAEQAGSRRKSMMPLGGPRAAAEGPTPEELGKMMKNCLAKLSSLEQQLHKREL